MIEPCPLCDCTSTSLIHKGGKASGFRDFLHCDLCDMVFVPRSQLLTPDQQKARYLQHNNDVNGADYRKFLARLYDELRPHLKSGSKGLDYGCGPGPALAAMMREDGFEIALYDIFFHTEELVLDERYDFITCTETAEHFSDPAAEFQRLATLLKNPGWVGVMTGMLSDWSQFPDWYYHRDPTHVNFFSPKTMRWIAEKHGWEASFPATNVALFLSR